MPRNKNSFDTKDKSQYYMYGTHAVAAAAANKLRTVKKIYCLPKQAELLKSQIKHHEIEIVDNNFINKKIGEGLPHQGIIALVNGIFQKSLDNLNFTPGKDRVVILDQINDPQNVGAIIRSAAAFGIDKIILPKDNSPAESAAIAKAACGCLELVQVAQVTNIQNTIKFLKDRNFWVVGLDSKGTQDFTKIADIDKIAIIIGSEGKGMRKLTSSSCDFQVKIPISDRVESLNASNAAGIIFYLLNNLS